MNSPKTILETLRRPRLLVRAAHLGLGLYDRERSMRRLFPDGPAPSMADAFEKLAMRERSLEDMRISGEASYSVARHVEVLAALIFEARLQERCTA